MDLKIRQANLTDLPFINDICLKTGLNGQDASEVFSHPDIVGHYYAEPYIHFELDACFVIDDGSRPQGYIVGTSSTRNFNDWMNAKWLPAIRKKYPVNTNPESDLEKNLINTIHTDCSFPDFLNQYPGHLHIDLLQPVRRKGFGKKLMEEFIDKLIIKRSTGLFIIADTANTDAIAFYRKVGLVDLKKETGSIYMGIKLND